MRLHFDILDTCKAVAGTCPSSHISPIAHCWERCQSVPGGYDGGGGPRRASPSAHKLGFVFEAPLQKRQSNPDGKVYWFIHVGNGTKANWLALHTCDAISTRSCLAGKSHFGRATRFSMYDAVYAADGRSFTTRLAIDNSLRAPVVKGTVDGRKDLLMENEYGFWDYHDHGIGRMRPSEGWQFTFTTNGPAWQVRDVEWKKISTLSGRHELRLKHGEVLDVEFQRAQHGQEIIV